MNDVEEALARFRAQSDAVAVRTAELHTKRMEMSAKREKNEEEQAKENRGGKNGQDWVILQKRIDNGETSLEQIYGGVDQSSEAQNVFKGLKSQLNQVTSKIDEYFDENPDLKAQYDKLREAGV